MLDNIKIDTSLQEKNYLLNQNISIISKKKFLNHSE